MVYELMDTKAMKMKKRHLENKNSKHVKNLNKTTAAFDFYSWFFSLIVQVICSISWEKWTLQKQNGKSKMDTVTEIFSKES